MLGIFLAHPTEACAGGFQGMAPVSNACWWRQIASVTLTVPGETESSSAELQLDKGYLGRPSANRAAGPRRTCVRRGLFFQKPSGHRSHPSENLRPGTGARFGRMSHCFRHAPVSKGFRRDDTPNESSPATIRCQGDEKQTWRPAGKISPLKSRARDRIGTSIREPGPSATKFREEPGSTEKRGASRDCGHSGRAGDLFALQLVDVPEYFGDRLIVVGRDGLADVDGLVEDLRERFAF